MSDNPYASPLSVNTGGGYGGGMPPANDGYIKQVPVIGILMIIFGILEFLTGTYYAILGFWVPGMMAASQPPGGPPLPADQVEFMTTMTFWVFIGLGAGGVIGGLLRLAGGIQVVRFRSHTLGVIGNIAGLGSITTCYCLPTAVGVTVYGLIILMNSSVRQEFMRRAV